MSRIQFVGKHAIPSALTGMAIALVIWFWLSIYFGVTDWFDFVCGSFRLPR